MRLNLLATLATLASLTLAYPQFSSPAAGAQVPVTGGITAAWTDNGDAPALADLSTYQLFLCAGSNANHIDLINIVPAGTAIPSSNSVKSTVAIPASAGGPGTNAYFLRMESVIATGGTVITYSPRFTLTGMTGAFPAAIQTAIAAGGLGTAGPDPVLNEAAAADPATGTAIATGAFAVPFNEQTGLTRYAPMMAIPPTKITKSVATPLFPKSSVKIATTYLPTPSIDTTVTAPQTMTISMKENTAAPAALPNEGDMKKYLKRWQDSE